MSQPTPIEAQKYNFIPISYELISHVRRIDGFDVSATIFTKS